MARQQGSSKWRCSGARGEQKRRDGDGGCREGKDEQGWCEDKIVVPRKEAGFGLPVPSHNHLAASLLPRLLLHTFQKCLSPSAGSPHYLHYSLSVCLCAAPAAVVCVCVCARVCVCVCLLSGQHRLAPGRHVSSVPCCLPAVRPALDMHCTHQREVRGKSVAPV